MPSADHDQRPGWTFLSNHGHVLMCIASDPEIRGRDIAERVGITERATQSIIADLVEGGYVTKTKVGRRNSYKVQAQRPLRHSVESRHTIGELLDLLNDTSATRSPSTKRRTSTPARTSAKR